MPSLPKSLGQDFNCNLCEYSFKNHKDLNNPIGNTFKSIISARKEHRTSVSEEPHLILMPLKLFSREEDEDTSCQEKQSELDEYKIKT